jgi:hypothetical protein
MEGEQCPASRWPRIDPARIPVEVVSAYLRRDQIDADQLGALISSGSGGSFYGSAPWP